MPTTAPPAARRNYRISRLIAQRAAKKAREARPKGIAAVSAVVVAHQVAEAQTSQQAVVDMLIQQDITARADALLNLLAFTTEPQALDAMVAATNTDDEFERLVASIVQDAARAAESVAVTVRPDIYHVRYVNLPCCSRCAVLAGRVYRWSTGFQRHPGCDCTMIPTTVASALHQNLHELVQAGQVRGLSQDDLRAIKDGADLFQVVNIRKKRAGLLDAGHALTRAGKPTPSGIYRVATDREDALRRLQAAGYIR